MPHLSPMSWLTAPLLFSVLMLPVLMASLWWAQTPSFPLINLYSKNTKPNNWNWN